MTPSSYDSSYDNFDTDHSNNAAEYVRVDVDKMFDAVNKIQAKLGLSAGDISAGKVVKIQGKAIPVPGAAQNNMTWRYDHATGAMVWTALTGSSKVNVTNYLPGGVPTGTDDTAYFAAALAAAGEGGTVEAPRFTTPYILDDLEYTHEGQTIEGHGMGLTYGARLKAKAGATNVVKIDGLRYCSMRNLVIDGNERASRGLRYEATVSATGQNLLLERVMFYRCTRGWHLGPGPGAISQTDKNTLINCEFIECDYSIYNEAVNSQETILINCDFGTIYNTGIHLLAGCVSMIGGQFQGSGAVGTATTTNGSPNLTLVTPTNAFTNGMGIIGTGIPAATTIVSGGGTGTLVMSANATASAAGVAITALTKGIAIESGNVGWVNLKDVIFEGPQYDVFGGPGYWPHDGLVTENVVFQAPTTNVLVNATTARMSCRHTRFNQDFDPPTTGNGYISWNQGGGILRLESCDYGPPAIVGAVLPIVIGGGSPYNTVASAGTITIPLGAEVVHVTGTTNITSITGGNVHQGRVVTLIFDDILTLVDGSNLEIVGDFTTAAGDAITLACDGAAWYEC